MSDEDECIELYLRTIQSPKFRRVTRRVLEEMRVYMRSRKCDLLSATKGDFMTFLKDVVDQKQVHTAQAKWRYVYALQNLNKYVKRYFDTRGEERALALPDRDLIQFTRLLPADPDVDALLNEDNVYAEGDLHALLAHARLNWKVAHFITLCLLAFSGARISEVVSLKRRNIILSERCWISGLVPGHAKTGLVVHFFPPEFVDILAAYMQQVALLYPDSEFAFPPNPKRLQPPDAHISVNGFRNHIYRALGKLGMENKIGQKVVAKGFRDLINTLRKTKFGLDYESRAKIIGHKLKGVNASNYLKRLSHLRKLRDLYDRNFPYGEFVKRLFRESKYALQQYLEELKTQIKSKKNQNRDEKM